jgi:hypothetical protein
MCKKLSDFTPNTNECEKEMGMSSHCLTQSNSSLPSPNDTERELKIVKTIVESYLEWYPELRNSTEALIKRIQGTNKGYANLKSESIARAMRQIQNHEGRYIPTDPEVIKKKLERSIEFRKHYRR